jgi:hypothetical protein
MARSMAEQVARNEATSLALPGKPGEFEEFWPEEPTAVEAATTMEELILDELRRQGPVSPPANDAGRMPDKGRKGTFRR